MLQPAASPSPPHATRVGGPRGEEWLELRPGPLPADEVLAWVPTPGCGAVVTFVGTARDHSEAGPGVRWLEYEAYDEHVVPSFEQVVAEVRARWPEVGRVALLHRTGRVALTEAAVLVAAGAPHREEAFAAVRHALDVLKATAPIWKCEVR